MPKFLKFGLGLSLCFVLGTSFLIYRPDMRWNPYIKAITSQLKHNKGVASLTPQTIKVGAEYSDVVRHLRRSGFKENNEAADHTFINKKFLIACEGEYVVKLKLDKQDKVISASGFLRNISCL